MPTLHAKAVSKTGLNMLTVQVAGHVWTDDTQGRCMMRSLAVPNFDVLSTKQHVYLFCGVVIPVERFVELRCKILQE